MVSTYVWATLSLSWWFMLFTMVHYTVNGNQETHNELEVLTVAEEIVVACCCQFLELCGLFLGNGNGHIEEDIHIGIYMLCSDVTNTKAIQQFRYHVIRFFQQLL